MTPADAERALRDLAPASPVAGGRVRCDVVDGVAHVRLDHPEARSAVTFRMMVDLAAVVVELGGFEGHGVVVSSTDPAAFCAGGHLGELLSTLADADRSRRMARAMAAVLDGLRDLPPPVAVAVHAIAVGGGAEVATAGDWRVFAPAARAQFVHTRLGVVPGWGGAARLQRIVGPGVALRWLATGEAVDAPQALRTGFADAVADDAVAHAFALLEPLRGRAPAVQAAKAQLRGDADAAADQFAATWGGPAHRAALAARGR